MYILYIYIYIYIYIYNINQGIIDIALCELTHLVKGAWH